MDEFASIVSSPEILAIFLLRQPTLLLLAERDDIRWQPDAAPDNLDCGIAATSIHYW